jgi:hypothetical protein
MESPYPCDNYFPSSRKYGTEPFYEVDNGRDFELYESDKYDVAATQYQTTTLLKLCQMYCHERGLSHSSSGTTITLKVPVVGKAYRHAPRTLALRSFGVEPSFENNTMTIKNCSIANVSAVLLSVKSYLLAHHNEAQIILQTPCELILGRVIAAIQQDESLCTDITWITRGCFFLVKRSVEEILSLVNLISDDSTGHGEEGPLEVFMVE